VEQEKCASLGGWCPSGGFVSKAARGTAGVAEASSESTRRARASQPRQRRGALSVTAGAGCDVPVISMRRARWVAGGRQATRAGEWLEAPQRCLAAVLGSRDGRCGCWVRCSIVHGDGEEPGRLADAVGCARRAGREALLWPEPLRAQVGCCEESDFTACVGEGALLGALGRGSDDNNTTRGCRAEEACVRVCGCESTGCVERSWCGCQRIAALEFCPGRAWLVERQ
jgi:hypothetical protein